MFGGIQGFNSTLVRLRQKGASRVEVRSYQFQFHIGSIKTKKLTVLAALTIFVSIPHWFD